MSLLLILIVAAIAHFVADFPMQAMFQERMGKKNTLLSHLFNHVIVYTMVFATILSFALGITIAMPIALFNGAAHMVIDYFTSRGSHACWKRGVRVGKKFRIDAEHECEIKYNQKWVGPFWCVIGFDQMLHAIVMFISFALFGVLQ